MKQSPDFDGMYWVGNESFWFFVCVILVDGARYCWVVLNLELLMQSCVDWQTATSVIYIISCLLQYINLHTKMITYVPWLLYQVYPITKN